jgi:hypothetical protein
MAKATGMYEVHRYPSYEESENNLPFVRSFFFPSLGGVFLFETGLHGSSATWWCIMYTHNLRR